MTRWWRRGSVLALAAVLAAVCAGCGAEPSYTVEFTVDGMSCESCSAAITTALESVDGVQHARADHIAGSAEAVVRGRGVSPEDLVAEIEGLGYTVTSVTRHDTDG